MYLELARIGKCLSSPKRLELLDLLSQGPKSVERLARHTGMSVANASQHLQVLFDARLVRFSKQGNYVVYDIADASVAAFMVGLRRLGEERSAEMQLMKSELFRQHEGLEAVTLEELAERMDRGDVVLLDVRPREEYDKGHIPGAVSIPFEELEQHLATLPADKEIVAYCRGPYCLYSAQAVESLRRRGRRALRLEEGVHEYLQFAAARSAARGGSASRGAPASRLEQTKEVWSDGA